MAIPLTNAKLSEMGPDLGKGILPLSDKLLKQRSGNFTGNGSISTADLRGTIANTMTLNGLWDTNNPRPYESHWRIFDQSNVLSAKDCTQDSNGKYFYSLTHKGNLSDAGVQSYNYGKLPSSGQFIAKFGNIYVNSTSHTFWQLEVIGSKTSWLKGGNKVYTYKKITGNAATGPGWTTDPIDIDPLYPYLTLSVAFLFPGRTSSESRRGDCTGMEAYLV